MELQILFDHLEFVIDALEIQTILMEASIRFAAVELAAPIA